MHIANAWFLAEIVHLLSPRTMNRCLKILIADDEAFFADNLKRLLAEEGLTSVHIAYDGGHAMQFIQREHFDAYLLDLNLPVFSGDRLAEEITKGGRNPRIIFMSAYSNLVARVRAIYPAYPVLEKPFEFQTLSQLLI